MPLSFAAGPFLLLSFLPPRGELPRGELPRGLADRPGLPLRPRGVPDPLRFPGSLSSLSPPTPSTSICGSAPSSFSRL